MNTLDPRLIGQLRAFARDKEAVITQVSQMSFEVNFSTIEDCQEAIAKFINAATGTLLAPTTVRFTPRA